MESANILLYPPNPIEKHYFCEFCHQGCYFNSQELDDHLFTEHGGPCCFRCHLVFYKDKDFTIHMRKRHKIKHVCRYCPEGHYGLMYRKHIKAHYQCIYCPKFYRTPKELYKHLHEHDKPFTCPINYRTRECLAKFNTKHSLRRHLVKKHFEKPCSWLPSLTNPETKF